MNPDNQLIIGIVLIAIGGLIGVLAYLILTDRSPDENDEVETEDEEVQDAEGAPDDGEDPQPDKTEPDDDPSNDADPDQPEEVSSEINGLEEDAPSETDETSTEDMLETLEEEATPPTVEEEAAPDLEPTKALAERISVATLLREETTGALIVKVGDREYLTSESLKESSDWTRVEYAAADLAMWLAGTPGVSRLYEKPEVEDEELSLRSKSMVEQINEILQRNLADTPGDLKAIRLIEGTDGSVRVLIGVDSYAIDEVPDPEANKHIREAVATWEDRQ